MLPMDLWVHWVDDWSPLQPFQGKAIPLPPLFPLPLALFGRLGAELRILVSHYININIMRQGVEQLPTILEMEINKFQKWTDDVPFHSVSSFSPSLSKSLSHSTVEVECRCKINVITQYTTWPTPPHLLPWKTVLNSQMCPHTQLTQAFTTESKHNNRTARPDPGDKKGRNLIFWILYKHNTIW